MQKEPPQKIVSTFVEQWIQDGFPFTFEYNGRPSEAFLSEWEKITTKTTKETYNEYKITYRDLQTKMELVVNAKQYRDFPAVEWVMHFQNNNTSSSPILSNILPLSWEWDSHQTKPIQVDYALGSQCQIDDFLPKKKSLQHWNPYSIGGFEGRSSVPTLPFFKLIPEEIEEHIVSSTNLNYGEVQVVEKSYPQLLLGIGWSGQWKTTLTMNKPARDAESQVMIEMGQENTHFRLLPNEHVRTPRILLLFADTTSEDAQNQWRALILQHYTLHRDNKRITVPIFYPTWGGETIQEHKERLQNIVDKKLPYEYYWVDAGWYIGENETQYLEKYGLWAKYVGHWIPNSKLYPNGLKELGDAVHNAGLKFLLWFEPERARKGTDWFLQHPEWFLDKNASSQDVLLNLGDPKVRTMLFNFLADMIQTAGIDFYRQDFNTDPMPFWQKFDAPDRQGITEIHHIEGLYQLWDDLLQRFPHLMIDNCSSGGRRIDLETTMRSIPLWRSDYQCFVSADPIGSQIHTAGLMKWIPLSATGTNVHPGDTYNARSAYSTGLDFHDIVEWQTTDKTQYPYDWQRKILEEYIQVRPLMEGNYYLHTTVSESSYDWLIMQYYRPDLHKGVILSFRRPKSPYKLCQIMLKDIDPNQQYEISNPDTQLQSTISGKILQEKGLDIQLDQPRSSSVTFYRIK
jgi:alpha-galactosidase